MQLTTRGGLHCTWWPRMETLRSARGFLATVRGRSLRTVSSRALCIWQQLREDRGFIANLGRAYLETGELTKAATRFMLVLRLAPNELEGYNGLAEVSFRQGDYERALQLFGQSLKLYGDQPEVVSRLREIAQESEELEGKAQWALANYAHRGAGPLVGRVPDPLGIPDPRGAAPTVPVPGIPIPQPMAPVPERAGPGTPMRSE